MAIDRSESGGRAVRVVHVVGQLDTGGMEKLLVEFARHVNRERFELHFVSMATRGTLAGDLEACGWPVTALDVGPGLCAGLMFRLAALFRRWSVDVVHTHNTRPLIYAAPAARLARVAAVVHTRHGQNYRSSRGGAAGFQLAARLADHVVCVSEDSARLSAAEGISAERVRTIRNGIDLSRFAYCGPSPDGPAVMVARLSPEKDVQTLIRAAAIVFREDPSFRLEVAGGGPCLAELKELTRELGLTDCARFLGEVRDVASVLGGASLFVLPSVTEGISLTLLEAMARGLPVVATRVGGTPEVVVEGETGLLIPPRAPRELAQAMLRLRRNPAAAHAMGVAGRRRVEACFDVRRMISDYQTLYDGCIGASQSAAA